MRLQSTEFKDGDRLPDRFAASHANISPPIHWSNPPRQARSFTLICEDDSTSPTPFIHWCIYNIPAGVNFIPENGSVTLANSEDIAQGLNDTGSVGYFGPKPPGKENHQYRFRLFALKEPVHVAAGVDHDSLMDEIAPFVIEESDLIGMYRGS